MKNTSFIKIFDKVSFIICKMTLKDIGVFFSILNYVYVIRYFMCVFYNRNVCHFMSIMCGLCSFLLDIILFMCFGYLDCFHTSKLISENFELCGNLPSSKEMSRLDLKLSLCQS